MHVKAFFILLIIPFFCNAQSVDNLDIKNGFLQFKFGDSISLYKDILNKPSKSEPHKYEVKAKGSKLTKYMQKLSLVEENGLIAAIEIRVSSKFGLQFMDDAMKKCYGEGEMVNRPASGNGDFKVRHSYLVWTGKRVLATVMMEYLIDARNFGDRILNTFELITIKKTSDEYVEGTLPPDFIL